MRDQQHRLIGPPHDPVDAIADHAQSINIQPAIGLIKHR